MEGNKDEADHCIKKAESFLKEGKRDLAEKFLKKAEKLYPSQKAKELLEKVQRFNMASKPTAKASDEPTLRHRPSGGVKKEQSAMEAEYSDEQLSAVKRIKKCKNYYEILGVTQDATDSDIKKAYKKLALTLHPDKNKAPGAAEGFKAIGNAVATLTDPEKRKQYDLFGGDEEKFRHSHSHESYTTRTFESDVTAEELFNMFFGGFPSAGTNVYFRSTRGGQWRRTAEQTPQQTHRETSNYAVLMQMLPFLIVIALSMMSSLLVSDPVYSLTQNHKFPVPRQTMNLRVPYYVKENFHTDYQGSIRRLEVSVEEEYISNLRSACYREKSYRDTLLWKAKNFADNDLLEKAQNIKTPSCDNLQKLIKSN